MATDEDYPIDLPILVIEAQIFVAVKKFPFLQISRTLVIMGHLRVTKGHLMVTLGSLRVTLG